MVSGYVTSDGKDLDSRYLGIKAKAASAKMADSVSGSSVSKVVGIAEANSVNINVSNKAGTATATYTITKRGLTQITCTGTSGGAGTGCSGGVYRNSSLLCSFNDSTKSYTVARVDPANTVYKVQFRNPSWANNTAKISGSLIPLGLTAI